MISKKGRQKRRRKIDEEQLKQAVTNRPNAFLYELAELFRYTLQAIFCMIQNLNITLKKTFAYYEKSEIEQTRFIYVII